jgi:hypothetical protein
MYYTFEIPIDRSPEAWERYATETQQLGPYASEQEAWDGLAATRGEETAAAARIVRID